MSLEYLSRTMSAAESGPGGECIVANAEAEARIA